MTAFRFHGSLERHGIALTKPFAQTPGRWQVLSAAWGEARSVPQIARRMGLTRQAVQRIANLLVADGLATFVPNPAHRGSPIVQLTARGVATVTKVNAAQASWVNRVARRLDGRRLAAAASTLEEVVTLLDRH
jgi:DNA-binding MarR family transcriptional regulator